MHGIVELILNSALLWIFLQTAWSILVSLFIHFCVPWMIWGSLFIALGLRAIRIPPTKSGMIEEVLGIDPFALENSSETSLDHSNEDQFCMRVVAHRGGGYDYPENSLTAFRNSKQKGCNAVEIDLSLTKDGVPIVFHDVTPYRLTGHAGLIKDMTWSELKELDITFNHPLREKFVHGDRIALLHDALEVCLENEQRIIIDIKEWKMDVVEVIIDTYQKYPKLFERALISSFNPLIIYMIRRREPRIVSALAWRPHFFSRASYLGPGVIAAPHFNNPFKHVAACFLDSVYEWSFSRFIYYVVGASALLLHKDVLSPRIIGKWHDRGIRVMAWTVNKPSEKLHFSRTLKVTYLTDTLLSEKEM